MPPVIPLLYCKLHVQKKQCFFDNWIHTHKSLYSKAILRRDILQHLQRWLYSVMQALNYNHLPQRLFIVLMWLAVCFKIAIKISLICETTTRGGVPYIHGLVLINQIAVHFPPMVWFVKARLHTAIALGCVSKDRVFSLQRRQHAKATRPISSSLIDCRSIFFQFIYGNKHFEG